MTLTETIINVIVATIVGLGFGSYATMAQYRIPNGRPWSSINLMEGDQIHCPGCKTKLHFKYWCPVIGFLRTGGKCVYCGMKVSRLYLFTELSITLLSIVNVLLYGFEQYYIPVQIFGSCLALLVVIEIEYRKVPDVMLMTMLLTAVMIRMLTVQDINMIVLSGMIAIAIGGCFRIAYHKVTKEVFPVHYVKLFAIAGVLFPFTLLLVFSVLCLILIIITKLLNKTPQTPNALPIIAAYFMVYYGSIVCPIFHP